MTRSRAWWTLEVHEVRLTIRGDNALGLPVEDLTAEELSVFEDGQPVEIVDFRLPGTAWASGAGC